MFFTTPTVLLGLAALGSSHMIMNTPVPYGKSTLTNSPLLADGTDFPCKQRTGVYEAEGASNSMALGSTQPLSFTGSATHGGGSCQISITYDKAPTKSSVFKVIHSIEGGCPIQNVAGNNGDSASAVDPSTYSFKIPTTLPTGDATLAWTWFNKIGNREMYMNCAPVTIGAASSKRDNEDLEARNITQLMERDTAAFNALPNMFTANIGNGCQTADSKDLIFPDAGDSVETLTGTSTGSLSAPTGNCAAAVAASGSAGSGATTAASSAATSAAKVSSAPASSAPALSGGVFATVATSASQPSVTSAASPVASSAAATKASSAATPASTGTTGSGSAIAAGTACTTEGMFNCIGGTSFQECASGAWSVVMAVAGGTTCTAGQSTSLAVSAIAAKPKRAIRFSQDHVRRRFNPENFNA
ncbi:hypothetical protein LSUE1_G003738 [Lachnellula suecica]|uniref:Chitin-binding type-4 domain-containing protein n=1 Tax=Lachnellula suecica TaxID=602035 RepID=A0A8T9C6I8_9HELO|nr:hypothetical protein LSUE1_G003738 [Lachnellula suecica]